MILMMKATQPRRAYRLDGDLFRTEHTDYLGNTVTTTRDPLDRIVAIQDAVRGQASQTWNGLSLIRSEDFNGNSTVLGHDALERVTSERDPGGTITTSYDDAGHRVVTTDRRGIVTVEAADNLGNLLTRTRGGTLLSQFSHDQQNRQVRAEDGAGKVSTWTYDSLGRLTRQAIGDQVRTFADHNDLGYPRQLGDGRTHVDLVHDFHGRVLQRTNALGERTSHQYDAAGNPLTMTTPSPTGEGQATTSWSYNLRGTLRSVTQADGAVTNLVWSPDWRVLTVTDAEDQRAVWRHDQAGRLVGYDYPGVTNEVYAYDGNDNRIGIQRAHGSAAVTYDHLNLPLDEVWSGDDPDQPGIHGVTRQRDANGNLTRVVQQGSEGDYARTITYDALDRPIQITDSRGLTLAYGYHANGSRASFTDHTGRTLTYAYDDSNRLSRVEIPGIGQVDYSYQVNGLPRQRQLPNGVVTSWDFDAANRLVGLAHQRPDGGETRFTMGYLGDGSRDFQREERGDLGTWETRYTYDRAGRLTGWSRTTPHHARTTTLTLDTVGNRLDEVELGPDYHRQRIYQLGSGHQIMGFSETLADGTRPLEDRQVVYDYDGNGNRLAKTELDQVTGNASRTDFIWDVANRLRRVDQNGSPHHFFDYDDLNRRIRKTGDTRHLEPIHYLWDELSVIGEMGEPVGGSYPTLSSYLYGASRLAMDRVGGALTWFGEDPGGSTADQLDPSGMLTGATTYTPFGREERLLVGADDWNRIGFAGHEYDPELALTYAKARYYDQDLGVFTGSDPYLGDLNTPPSLHRYLYAFGNPTRFHDPTGLFVEPIKEERKLDEENPNFYGQTLGEGADLAQSVHEAVGDATDVAVEFTIYGDYKVIADPDAPWFDKALVIVSVIPLVKGFRLVDKANDLRHLDKAHDAKKLGKGHDAKVMVDAEKDVGRAQDATKTADRGRDASNAAKKVDKMRDAGTSARGADDVQDLQNTRKKTDPAQEAEKEARAERKRQAEDPNSAQNKLNEQILNGSKGGKKNPRRRLPKNNGQWESGTPGNGFWKSDIEEVNKVTGDKPIQFIDGRPIFTPYSKGSLKFPQGTLDGSRKDFDIVYEYIAQKMKLPNKTAGKQWLSQQKLTPHHLNDTTIELIPTDLHGNIPHIGSASDMRGGF